MAQPPSKKQRTGNAPIHPMAPIVFKTPIARPDMRVKVFRKEFHIHSTILKLYSEYFRKFLDSPEKPSTSSSNPSTTQFKYDYISIVDEDGEWGLEPVSMVSIFPDHNLSVIWTKLVWISSTALLVWEEPFKIPLLLTTPFKIFRSLIYTE
jgi:hypothetical protein